MAATPPDQPSALWRAGSAITVGLTGTLSWLFLRLPNRLELHDSERFIELLEQRRDVGERTRGLITVANHTSVLDDPLMWGCLPFKYFWDPSSMRWSMGSHDIMFKNKPLEVFFSLGQTLPTHRLHYSKYGGLFQPTVGECVRLLSGRPFSIPTEEQRRQHIQIADPFSDAQLSYTTTGTDLVPSPSAYLSRRYSWVHIFPEGKIHQHKDKIMRYFKWGVSRLILESEPCPDLVPIWIEGFEQVMHESRSWPRPLPRVGADIHVWFGEKVDGEERFGDLRRRWRVLFDKARAQEPGVEYRLGEVPESLKHDSEAIQLRQECTMRVREEVLRLRRYRGLPDEDPKCRLVDTWREEGQDSTGSGEKRDGSWVKDM